MASPNEQTLSQEIQAELQAKRQRLVQLEQEETHALAYMHDLEAQAQAMQLLNTSAREAQNTRFMLNTGMTVEQQIGNQRAKLSSIKADLAAVRDTIELLSRA